MNSVWCYRHERGAPIPAFTTHRVHLSEMWWVGSHNDFLSFCKLPPLLQQKLAVLMIAPEQVVIEGVGINYGRGLACAGVFEVVMKEGEAL